MPDLIGKKLGQYEIIGLLGEGGMATVYRARQGSIGRDVAIKVLSSKLTTDPDFLRRFEREARTVAALNHPHILKIFDYGETDGQIYLVMELHPGGSLASLIKQGPFATDRAAKVLDQIASALDYAHEQGIVHRDLKPQNVLLDGRNNAILTDFGIAKLMTSNATVITVPGMAIGTPAYMSPEQWQGRSLDARSDIYSLGVMLFEMLSGRLPFNADTPASLMYLHVAEPPPSIRNHRTDLLPPVEAVIALALAKDPTARFQSAGDMAAAYRAALAGRLPSNAPVSQDAPLTSPVAAGFPPADDTFREGIPSVMPTHERRASAANLKSGLQRTNQQPTLPRPRNRQSVVLPGVLVGGAVIIVALVGLIIALLSGQTQPSTPAAASTATPETASQTAVVLAPSDAPPTSTAVLTLTPTPVTPEPSPTTAPTNTDIPTAILDSTATAQALLVAAAATETANAIASFTATPEPSETPDVRATLNFISTVIVQTQTAMAPTITNTPTHTHTPDMQATINEIVRQTMAAAVPPTATATLPPSLTPIPTVGFEIPTTPRQDTARREFIVTLANITGQEFIKEFQIAMIDQVGATVSVTAVPGSISGDVRIRIPAGPAQVFIIRVTAIGFDGNVLAERSAVALYDGTGNPTPTRTRTPVVRTPTAVAYLGAVPAATAQSGTRTKRGVNTQFQHKDDGTIKAQALNVNARDFVVEATFGNPYATSRGGWDIGFLFRHEKTKNNQWRLVITSGGDWYLYNAQGTPPTRSDASGRVRNLNTSASGSNTLRLAVLGELGILFVNNVFVTTFNLAARMNPGDVQAAVGLTAGREIEGESTPLSNFVAYFPTVGRGGMSGTLPHEVDNRIEGYKSGVVARNFVVDATFTTPYTSSTGVWDAGYLFRHEGDNRQLRLVVVSNGNWYVGNADGAAPRSWSAQGRVRNLNTGLNTTNRITLIAIWGRGALFVNGVFVSSFDLSARTNSGDVFIATDFFTDNEIANTSTKYSNFFVWVMD